MPGSLMNPDPTAPARRSPVDTVEVTPSTAVRLAAEVLAARHQSAVVVTDHGLPVGVVTVGALMDDGAPPTPEARVADVMDYEVVRIDPGAGERETLHAFREAAWLSLRHRHPCALGE
jgi:CBS domain-containing protein